MKWIDNLMPGLGFFGPWGETKVVISIGSDVEKIRLFLTSDGETILNLVEIEIFGREGEKVVPKIDWKACQSSIYDKNISAYGLLSGTGIHTSAEVRPWWQVCFPEAIFISAVAIRNRRDRWGERSRTLSLAIGQSGGIFQDVWHAKSMQSVSELLACARAMNVDERLLYKASIDGESLKPYIADFRKSLSDAIATKVLGEFKPAWWLPILSTIELFEPHAANDYEQGIVASYLLWKTYVEQRCPIEALQIFERILPMRSSISDLQDRMNALARFHQRPTDLIITRHGIFHQPLKGRSQGYMTALRDCINLLSLHDVVPMICYGTLLGARRSGEFLPMDDDVDVLCVSSALTDQHSTRMKTKDLINVFKSEGWRVDPLDRNFQFHVGHHAGESIDVFLCWTNGVEVSLHMEKMRIRQINLDVLLPTNVITLHGVQVPCPGKVDDFLSDRYGPSWQTPDHFFEWPWALL